MTEKDFKKTDYDYNRYRYFLYKHILILKYIMFLQRYFSL